MRLGAVAALLLALALAPAAAARRPVVAYGDAAGALHLFDAETGASVPAPPLPTGLNFGFRKVSASHNGRFVVYVQSSRVHLVDRATDLEKRLPGLPDIGTGAFVTVTGDGDRIAHDAGSNGPVTIYDRSDEDLVANTLAADFRQPVLSGDGQYVVGTRLNGCGAAATGSDVCLHRMSDFSEVTLPEQANDDEDPCIDGDGSLLAVTIPNPTMHDLFEYDVPGAGNAFVSPPGTATPADDERFCSIDSAGAYIGYQVNGAPLKLYNRATDGFVTLPAGVSTATTLAALVDPYTAPAPTGPRKPVVAYLDGGGAIHLWDAQAETETTLSTPVIPLVGLSRRWSISHNGRFVVWLDGQSSIHLYDRVGAGSEVALPGVDQFTDPQNVATRPGSLTASDTGVIAFDVNTGSGPARVYDSAAKVFVDAGFPAGSDNVQTRLSGDGRFLATSCKMGSFACSPDLGSDDSVYLQNLVTKTDAGLPENPAGFTSRDEQHPCVNADGSVVGMDVPNPNATTRDIFLYDRGGAAWVTLPAGVMDLATTPNANDTGCRLDSSGSYLGFDDAAFNFHVYDRAHDGFLLLPPGAASPVETVWLTQPYPPPATGGGGPSGGGGGPAPPGGGDTPPPAPPAPPAEPAARDTKPPTISLRVAARQRVRKGFVAVVSCDEPCALTVKATVGTGRGVALGTKRRGLARGQFRARFKVSRRTAARISRLLRRSRRPVKAVVIVRAVDAAGNAASKKRPVRVR